MKRPEFLSVNDVISSHAVARHADSRACTHARVAAYLVALIRRDPGAILDLEEALRLAHVQCADDGKRWDTDAERTEASDRHRLALWQICTVAMIDRMHASHACSQYARPALV